MTTYRDVILKWKGHRVVSHHDHSYPDVSENAPATFMFVWTRYGWELSTSVNPNLTEIPQDELVERVTKGTDFPSDPITWYGDEVQSELYYGYVQGAMWLVLSIDSMKWRKRIDMSRNHMITSKFLQDTGRILANWARGDSYVLSHERLETYYHPVDGTSIEQWRAVDEMGGIYTDSRKELGDLARNMFVVPADAEFIW